MQMVLNSTMGGVLCSQVENIMHNWGAEMLPLAATLMEKLTLLTSQVTNNRGEGGEDS